MFVASFVYALISYCSCACTDLVAIVVISCSGVESCSVRSRTRKTEITGCIQKERYYAIRAKIIMLRHTHSTVHAHAHHTMCLMHQQRNWQFFFGLNVCSCVHVSVFTVECSRSASATNIDNKGIPIDVRRAMRITQR